MHRDYFSKMRLSALLLSLGVLSGCALVPGMSIENNADRLDTTNAYINPVIIPITPTVIQQVSPDLRPYEYHIGIGDQLNVLVWGHPEFSTPAGQANAVANTSSMTGVGSPLVGLSAPTSAAMSGYLVNSKGMIFFPLLGYVHVAGLTQEAISQLLTEKLAKYVKKPQVIAQVTNFSSQKVYVLGELNQGQQPAALIPINNTPMTLAYALSAVGGINQSTADTSQVYVIRGSYTNPTVYWLDAESPAAMLYADNFPLGNHDVVFVSAAPVVRWNRVLNQILPSIQTIYFTKQLVNP